MIDIKIPPLGENIASAVIVSIPVSVGGSVKKDDTILQIEAEKASIDIPSPVDGVVKEVLVQEKQEVAVGQTIMKFETAEEQKESAPQKGEQPKQNIEEERPKAEAGRTKKEEVPAAETRVSQLPSPAGTEEKKTVLLDDVPASPSVRRLAREIGIDITRVAGSGPGGRIKEDDIKASARQQLTAPPRTASPDGQLESLPDFSKWGEVERKPMSSVRVRIYKHLTMCWRAIPHVVQYDKADLTEVEKLIKKYSTPERKITITAFMVKVAASALKVFPQFNAGGDTAADEIIYKKYCHIGIAVDTPRGLLVPVIRDADQKNILTLAAELAQIAEQARQQKIKPDDMQGGCFTVTNLGGIGGTSFAPIINWPQVAILGVPRSRIEPVYQGDKFVPRPIVTLSLSYDHRFIDGADGARFIKWVKEALEQPLLLELEG